jgi:cell division protein FtsN
VRAKLALHGVESNIQRVSGEKNALNRIRVGPIADLEKLNRLRATLRKMGVDFMQVRVSD